MDWKRQQVFLDAAGKAVAAARPGLVVRVILLPAGFPIVGKTYLELQEIARQAGGVADYHVKDYLPGYASKLTSDLEVALATGKSVYLWEMPGALLLFGHAALAEEGFAWSDCESWYRTAQDALIKRNPRPQD